jgi:hypothetical protein
MTGAKYWLVTAFYVLLAMSGALGLSLLIKRLPDVGQAVTEKELWIYKDHPVSQTVIPTHNGLNVVVLYLRNVSLRNQDPFTFTLTTSDHQMLRQISLTGYNITDGNSVRLQFPPIPDSKNQTYIITLSSPTPDISTAIGVGYNSHSDSYREGTATAENITGGDLTFQLYYFPQNRLTAIFDTLENVSRLILNLKFLAVLALAFSISFGFSWNLFKK